MVKAADENWVEFRPLAHFLYAVIAIELLVSIGIALAFGFRETDPFRYLPQLWCVLLVISGPLARRIDRPRLGGACETVGLLYGQGFALVSLLYPLTAIARPFADPLLSAADQAIGFDWLATAAFLRDRDGLLTVAYVSYFSFAWQGAVILPALFVVRKGERAWQAIIAANLALLMTMVIYPFFPAEGPFIHYGVAPSDFPNLKLHMAWDFGPAIHAIRDEGARLITRELITAFVSIPSYHTAAALIFTWAAWPMRWLRWPVLILNVLMAYGAIVVGAHYLVDLFAGYAVGAVALWCAKDLRVFAGLGKKLRPNRMVLKLES